MTDSLSLHLHPSLHLSSKQPPTPDPPSPPCCTAAAISDNICLILPPSTAEWNQSGRDVMCEQKWLAARITCIWEHGASALCLRRLRGGTHTHGRVCEHANTQRCGRRTPDGHHTDISELSPIHRLSITSNPPKTWRIKAESITHSSLHSALFFREITAEGEKQSQDPILSRRKALASPEDKGRTLLSSLWLTHNKKKSFKMLWVERAGINQLYGGVQC